MAIGQNPTIKDGILRIEMNEWLVPIKNEYPKLEADYLRLEPLQVLENKERTELFNPVRRMWLHVVNDVRTRIVRNKEYLYIPELKKIV